MDNMVQGNGTSDNSSGDPLAPSSIKTQSVIQSNQHSVIQTPNNNIQSVHLQRSNVIFIGKPNSVIQTPQGNLHTLQIVDAGSDDSLSNEDDSVNRKQNILMPSQSYKKLFNDLEGGEIAVIPRTIQIASPTESVQGLPTITMTNASTGSAIVQYATQGQDGQFYIPVVTQSSGGGGAGGGGGNGGGTTTVQVGAEDQSRKREVRLLKNREAARECRRKKKEYIKCLENRVAVLENQNKTLIEELKSLKELYCQHKTE